MVQDFDAFQDSPPIHKRAMQQCPACFPKRISLADDLVERVHDLNPIHFTALLKVFREKNATTGLFGGSQNQSIPKRKPVQSMEVNGGEDIGNFRGGDIELGE